jgi:DNA-directed RNA polymerase specialized sigma24 family protein
MSAVFDQRKRRSSAEVVSADLPDRPGRPAELHVTLMRALSALQVRDQAIVVLRHWADHSVETVAKILDVSMVKMQSMRALARLRELLGDDFARQ